MTVKDDNIDWEAVLEYARERFQRDLEDFLDDPRGIGSPDDTRDAIAAYRRRAAALGLEYDALVSTLGTEFERTRLRMIEAGERC